MRHTTRSKGEYALANDAIVVLCLKSQQDEMTWQDFHKRALEIGYNFTPSQCHNMLNRAIGYINKGISGRWVLTAAGKVYRDAVLDECTNVCAGETVVFPDDGVAA